MSNYRENGTTGKTARTGATIGAGVGALFGIEDILEGNILSGVFDFFSLGILGYVAGSIVDFLSYDGGEKSAKKSENNDEIYKKLTA